MRGENQATKRRVSVYIDGFNLYFGLKSKRWSRFYWLDVHALAERLLKPGQHLSHVRYFTAKLRGKKRGKHKRQTKYLDALGTRQGLSIHLGHYLSTQQQCRECGHEWTEYEEKMSDVNIAMYLLNDAHDDSFDSAILLTADSDLAGPIESVVSRYPNKRVIVAFPPGRSSVKLESIASGTYHIGENSLKASQLPENVVKPDGYVLSRPEKWR